MAEMPSLERCFEWSAAAGDFVPAHSAAAGGTVNVLLLDSATDIVDESAGAVVICGSHGGRYSAALAAQHGVRGIVFNDAGGGLDGAGVAGLELLEAASIPAVAIGHSTARIGDAVDTWSRGRVTFVNAWAHGLGCAVGMSVRAAAAHLARAAAPTERPSTRLQEARHLLAQGPPAVWALDSASLVRTEDVGAVVLTGSHGGLIGGDPARALKADALAAAFNDAGVGADAAGITRLPALSARGIPAFAVDAMSARIGDGRSTYEDGIVSAVNDAARDLGAHPGMSACDFVSLVTERVTPHHV